MPPLTRGKCGVPSIEHSIARLPPHNTPLACRPVEAGLGAKAHCFQRTGHRLDETIARDVVDTALAVDAAEVVAGHRPGPRWRARVGEQAHLQRGHVAVADPACAVGHAARDAPPVDRIEQPRHAVAAATGHRDRRCGVGHAVQRGQALLIFAGKTLVAQL